MERGLKRFLPFMIVLGGLIVLFLFYVFVGQEYLYAKKYANRLLELELPRKSEVIEQDFDYGVIYGGGPWGNGGYPTLVAYKRIRTELSEKEIFEYYNTDNFEIYFDGSVELKKNNKGQIWYEGLMKDEDALSTEKNDKEPMEVMIQYRTEFSYPFFIDFY